MLSFFINFSQFYSILPILLNSDIFNQYYSILAKDNLAETNQNCPKLAD